MEWFNNYKTEKDVIIKLHTGQGKTLIGLLILQSALNEGNGPAVYICPNNYLVEQIVDQAKSFGIKTAQTDEYGNIPQAFRNSEAILVTNCKKIFNGKSVFGVKGSLREPIQLGAIVIDDAHKCLDIIRESFSIKVDREVKGKKNPLYEKLWNLFEESLRRQAAGTCVDIINNANCIMAVPFWTWYDKCDQVLSILSEYRTEDELLFVWDLLKDHVNECTCIFSGNSLEISPRIISIENIPSFTEAKKRIFLSATLNEDSFLIKDLGISVNSVLNPLCSGDVTYSGERLILLPSLVDTNLQRKHIINWIQKMSSSFGNFGVVTIVPSFYHVKEWRKIGAQITDITNLYLGIDELKRQVKTSTAYDILVLVNEYDGVDLPDSTCRILVLDSLPSYSTLMHRYLQQMRPFSSILRRQLAQRVEQGMGRAIRGSSDWCIVVVVGNNLTDFLSEKKKREFLSPEAQEQIKIGEKLVELMKAEGGKIKAIETLTNQCLNRDESWKEFYKNKMNNLQSPKKTREHLDAIVYEREAELLYRQGQYGRAVNCIQKIVDVADSHERGWYLQLMATYLYPVDSKESMNKQLKAHAENSNLFRPEKGIAYSKLTSTGTRASRILDWIKKHESHNTVIIEMLKIMDTLLWGSHSESFEKGIQDLGQILGFLTDRPEKCTGKGPDNLWQIQGKKYWIIECKNMVKESRGEISKNELGQLGNSIGWFNTYYPDDEGIPVLIHPSKRLASNAYAKEPFWVVTIHELNKLRDNTKKFYKSLTGIPFDNLTHDVIDQKLAENKLGNNDFEKEYLKRGK